jgi:hypothetical protein
MFDIGRLKDGDTVVISGAAGSVGLVSSAPLTHVQSHLPLLVLCIHAGGDTRLEDRRLKGLTPARSHAKSLWLIRNVKS